MKQLLSLVLSVLMLLGIGAAAFAEAADVSAFKIAAPGGAPALALAALAVENPDNYTFVAAEAISAEFANNSSDFIIAPLNAGAKLYKMGKSTYKLGAVVSWGNLYFASQRENFTLEDMNGAAITLFGENTINASIALYTLKQNGIEPKSVSYLAGAANTQSLLLTDENAIVLTAEPALTAASMKNDRITSYALNDLYKKATGFDGYAQAGLFVNPETVKNHPEAVAEYLDRAKKAVALCENDLDSVVKSVVALEILPNAKVAERAIPRCALRYVSAADAREQVERTAQVDIAQFGGELPADGFYYVPSEAK